MEKRRGKQITQAQDCDFALSAEMEAQMGIKLGRPVTMGNMEARSLMPCEHPRCEGEPGQAFPGPFIPFN